jgi:hypothetical protein
VIDGRYKTILANIRVKSLSAIIPTRANSFPFMLRFCSRADVAVKLTVSSDRKFIEKEIRNGSVAAGRRTATQFYHRFLRSKRPDRVHIRER